MTVDDVKERLRYVWLLGQPGCREVDTDRRRRMHQSLANDFVLAVATDDCLNPRACAKLILLPVSDDFYQDRKWA